MTLDPLAEMTAATNPYVYCKNNPVKYIDPDGCKIQGATAVDIQHFEKNLDDFLKQAGLDYLKKYFHIAETGDSMDKISKEDYRKMMEEFKAEALGHGVNSDIVKDMEAFLRLLINAFNSKTIHFIEYVDYNGYTRQSEGNVGIKTDCNSFNEENGIERAFTIVDTSPVAGFIIDEVWGGAGNVYVPDGSYSYIVDNSSKKSDMQSIVLHELLGHGPQTAIGALSYPNNLHAIQVENLLRRLVGRSDFITEHGPVKVSLKTATSLPRIKKNY